MPETLGKVIGGKYRLLSKLGAGAMGVVYRAEQLDSQGHPLREVALKMLRPEFSHDPDFAQRFLREVRVAARLRNPNTVTVYDTGSTDDGEVFYTMEFIRGPTLKDLLRGQQGPLAVPRVISIVGQICEALAEAHSPPDPIVHRDLKPANIFIEERYGREWAKVGDFGIAKMIGEHTAGLTQEGRSVGTPRYMAPEQWKGQEVDGRVDLYALGIIMYEMLAGKLPFSANDDTFTLMYRHLHEAPPPLPKSIPEGVRLQVEQLLVKAPEERPSDALKVRQALESAMAEGEKSSPIIQEETKIFSLPGGALLDKEVRRPGVAEQKSADLRVSVQPDAVGPPGEGPPKGKTRRSSLSLSGIAGGIVVPLLLIGGYWYRLQEPVAQPRPQPTQAEAVSVEESQAQPVVGTEPAPSEAQVQPQAQSEQIPEGVKQETQAEAENPGEDLQVQQDTEMSPPEPQTHQQAKIDQPGLEGVSPAMEETQQVALTQRVAELLSTAEKQRAEKRLTTPTGDNALATYNEVLRIAPGNEGAIAGLKDIKEQYKQWGAAARQKEDWAKAQAHYEAALTIDPQDEASISTLQWVKKARRAADVLKQNREQEQRRLQAQAEQQRKAEERKKQAEFQRQQEAIQQQKPQPDEGLLPKGGRLLRDLFRR